MATIVTTFILTFSFLVFPFFLGIIKVAVDLVLKFGGGNKVSLIGL